jgi:hypothetical protein
MSEHEFKRCQDTYAEQRESEAKRDAIYNESWTSGILHDIRETYKQATTADPNMEGYDKCGPLPLINVKEWKIERTDTLSNGTYEKLKLTITHGRFPERAESIEAVGPVRFDWVAATRPVIDPGPNPSKAHPFKSVSWPSMQVMTWQDTQGRTNSWHMPDSYMMKWERGQ